MDLSRYAVGGVLPRRAVRPGSEAELVEALRAAARDRLSVVPFGGGIGLASGPAPGEYGMALDLTALDRIVEYEPEDLTLTAQCGATLDQLGRAVAERGQELPLEGARATRATLGGALAANASGPRRLRFGAPRDRILGARFALADGTVARSGGKVVKNVAGYGIHRLLCGSRGGLAVLLEASLKLAPAPESRAVMVFTAEPSALADASRWSAFPRLEPAWLTVVGPRAAREMANSDSPLGPTARAAAEGRRYLVLVGLEEDAARVRQQLGAVERQLGTPDHVLEGERTPALVQALTDLEAAAQPRLHATCPANTPAGLAPLLDLPEAEASVFHAPSGRLHVAALPGRLPALGQALAARGLTVIEAQGGDVEPALPPQVAIADLRGRIRRALDPGGSLALGTRWQHGTS